MTTVTAEPSAPSAEEERHRPTALEDVAALSLDALSSVAICRLRFQFAHWASPRPSAAAVAPAPSSAAGPAVQGAGS